MLPPSEQKALTAVRPELHHEVAKQIICASPLFTLTVLVPIGVIIVLIAMRESAIREIKARTQPRADAAAYAEGCLA